MSDVNTSKTKRQVALLVVSAIRIQIHDPYETFIPPDEEEAIAVYLNNVMINNTVNSIMQIIREETSQSYSKGFDDAADQIIEFAQEIQNS